MSLHIVVKHTQNTTFNFRRIKSRLIAEMEVIALLLTIPYNLIEMHFEVDDTISVTLLFKQSPLDP